MKTFDEFEKGCDATWYGCPISQPALYLAVAIAEEAGELCGHVKKLYRDDPGRTCTRDDAIKKELGDILFYVSRMARAFGVSLAEIAQMNHDKLADRIRRGVIKGDGDER